MLAPPLSVNAQRALNPPGNVVIIPAPGVGFAIRVVHLESMLDGLTTAISDGRWEVATAGGVAVSTLVIDYGLAGPAMAAGPGQNYRVHPIVPPGLQLPANHSLRYAIDFIRVTLVGTISINAQYYIDPVT